MMSETEDRVSPSRLGKIRLPLKAWLLLLAIGGAMPFALLAAYTIVKLGNVQEQSLTASQVQRGEAAANAVEQRLNTVKGALQGLAVGRAARNGEFEALYGNAQHLLKEFPEASAVTLISSDGTMIFNTLRPFGTTLPSAYDQPSLKRVFETGKPVVSGPFGTAFSDRIVVAVGVPVFNDGRVVYCLRMILRTAFFVDALRDQHLPNEWFAVIADDTGSIVARSHDPEKHIGKKVSPSLQTALAERREGTFDTKTLEGVAVRTAISHVPAWEWSVTIGVPLAILHGPLEQSLAEIGGGIAVVLAAGILAALWLSGQLSRARPLDPQGNLSFSDKPDASPAMTLSRKLEEETPGTIHLALPVVRYVVGLAIFGVALASRVAILPTEAGLGFLTFYPATAFAALLCGTGPGLMVMVLGGITANYAFMYPYWAWKWPLPYVQAVAEVPYLLSGIVICAIVHQMRRHARAVRQANLSLASEIEERKRVAAQLAETMDELRRSNHELDEFAYIASHDLKEPLRGIHNYVSFLREDYSDRLDEEGRGYLERMQRLAERLTALIDRLLAYSRLGSAPLTMEPVDMEAVLDDVAEDLKVSLAQQGVDLRRSGRLPTVNGNALRLGEVFQNLIGNAAKYNDKAKKWVEVGCDLSAHSPVFYVRDNGIGIPEQHRDSVFRIFKRLHEQNKYGGGTGAGLTIVKKIIQRHGGHIWLDSSPGEGTTFYFTLSDEQDAA